MHGLSHSPVVPPGLSACKCGTTCSASHQLAMRPLHPWCPSLPLLPIWMNVSSLTLWLSGFHTVQFSVSSDWFLFLNLFCPSFGCARRQNISTYTSMLPGSCFIDFLYHFSVFGFISFLNYLCNLLPSSCFGFILPFFFRFLRWKARSILIYASVHFHSSTVFAVSHKFQCIASYLNTV